MSLSDDELPFDESVPLPAQYRARRTRTKPAAPKAAGRPKAQEGPQPYGSGELPPTREVDPELWAVYDVLTSLDPSGFRTAYALRESFDQIYDGQRTGRWDYTQLMKTEKTHLGTLVEIWMQREFEFADGEELDYSVAGSDVDAKWSRNLYEWEFPLEMYTRGPKLAMVLWANDYTVRWAMGLIRVTESLLLPIGKQRDQKRKLNLYGKDSILWVHRDRAMIENTLMHLPSDSVERIFDEGSGQAAVNQLFREAQKRLVNRATVVTAAQQVDAGKRVRDARPSLASEGIVVFGHYAPHPQMATELGLPRPRLGTFVSARLAPALDSRAPATEIAGKRWRVAEPGEPIAVAPVLPRQGRSSGA